MTARVPYSSIGTYPDALSSKSAEWLYCNKHLTEQDLQRTILSGRDEHAGVLGMVVVMRGRMHPRDVKGRGGNGTGIGIGVCV